MINNENLRIKRPHDVNMMSWIPWTTYIDEKYGQKNMFKFLNFGQKKIVIAMIIAIFCFIV